MWRSWLVLAAVALLVPRAAHTQSGSPLVTFNNQIVRLLQDNCQGCHRPGEIGPFPLLTYADARSQQDKILGVVESRKMPPWKPAPGFGDFVGSRRLSEQQIDVVRAWIEAGAPEAVARDLPPPRQLPATWPL